MQIRRWALNAGIAGLALVIAGIAVATGGRSDDGGSTSFGWFSSSIPEPLLAISAQGVWGTALAALGVLILTWTVAWTVGSNASRPDATDAG